MCPPPVGWHKTLWSARSETFSWVTMEQLPTISALATGTNQLNMQVCNNADWLYMSREYLDCADMRCKHIINCWGSEGKCPTDWALLGWCSFTDSLAPYRPKSQVIKERPHLTLPPPIQLSTHHTPPVPAAPNPTSALIANTCGQKKCKVILVCLGSVWNGQMVGGFVDAPNNPDFSTRTHRFNTFEKHKC